MKIFINKLVLIFTFYWKITMCQAKPMNINDIFTLILLVSYKPYL